MKADQNSADHFRRQKSKRGLTLIELIVVLTVLVALGGILLPIIPNMLQRSHLAVCSTNIPELNKAMVTHQTMNLGAFPDRFDNLVDGTGAYTAGPDSGLPGADADYGTDLLAGTLTVAEVDALNAVGISTVIVPDWGGTNPTFEAHLSAGTATVLDDTTQVLLADPDHILEVFGFDGGPDGVFVVFGAGQQSTLVGNANGGVFEAPVHFSDDGDLTPQKAYSRYAVVFQVADADGDALDQARFVGAAAIHDGDLENVNEHLEEFYADL